MKPKTFHLFCATVQVMGFAVGAAVHSVAFMVWSGAFFIIAMVGFELS